MKNIQFSRYFALLLLVIAIISSCSDLWEEHYEETPVSSDMKLVDYLREQQNFGLFLEHMEKTGLDSILESDESKTLFIPTDAAFGELTDEDTINFLSIIMAYHISPTIYLSSSSGNKRLLTYSRKYLDLVRNDNVLTVNGIPVTSSGPICLDGKFYVLDSVLLPKPSIYNYMQLKSPFLKSYIDSFDTLFLDLSQSIPLGYNENNQTVYDSVYIEYNLFEEEFFPIRSEFRNRTATLLIFTQEQYDEAIEIMAFNMGALPSDIPEVWQNTVLLPYIMNRGVFEGSLEYGEFRPDLNNIKGDTSYVDPATIDPASEFVCSNGKVFNYLDFRVPEELYLGKRIFEAESFLNSLGLGRYLWKSSITKVSSTIVTEPLASLSVNASNDTIVTVSFQFDYTGEYWIEFTLDNVFAGDYLLEWRGNYRPSGSFKVYVNDVDVTTTSPMVASGGFDNYLFRNLIFSAEPGAFFVPDADRNNSVDFLVQDIINEYGNVRVKFEYTGSGSQSNNGLSIDYLALTPYKN
jgi:uncharacterized surface protein with fasciclin (FAS1) repeats